MRRNPFNLGAMEQSEWFYNRQSEVRDALGILRDKGNVEVLGPRRIGKTWFLRYISDPNTLREYGLDPQRNICVYIDCQRRPMQKEEPQVYQYILECIIGAAQRVGIDLASEPGYSSAPGIAFEQTLKDAHRQGLKVILLLDEFDVVARNSKLDVIFFNYLRALSIADDVNIAYVTASATSLFNLTLERETLLGSPFFNVFQSIQLKLFSHEDSRYLVEDTLERASKSFPDELVKLVLEIGGGHPFFLQMAGHHAFRLTITGDKMTEKEREALLAQLNKEAARHFEYYWRKLDPQDQYVLAALPLLHRDTSYQMTFDRLKDACLIAERNGRYHYFSPLFEMFVRNQQVNGLRQANPLLVDERRKRVLLRDEPLDLSPTNYELLRFLVQRIGEVVSYEELWQAVWSEEPHNVVEQVKSGIKSLRNALDGDADCIINRRGVGYMLQPPSQ